MPVDWRGCVLVAFHAQGAETSGTWSDQPPEWPVVLSFDHMPFGIWDQWPYTDDQTPSWLGSCCGVGMRPLAASQYVTTLWSLPTAPVQPAHRPSGQCPGLQAIRPDSRHLVRSSAQCARFLCAPDLHTPALTLFSKSWRIHTIDSSPPAEGYGDRPAGNPETRGATTRERFRLPSRCPKDRRMTEICHPSRPSPRMTSPWSQRRSAPGAPAR
jgi:hypothetical protein